MNGQQKVVTIMVIFFSLLLMVGDCNRTDRENVKNNNETERYVKDQWNAYSLKELELRLK